jgi:NSS family neurotransmitter:Na+ symporter
MLLYFIKYASGSIMDIGTDIASLGAHFGETVSSTGTVIISTFSTIIVCFLICSLGLQKGVERITKYMMLALLVLLLGLAVYCCTLSGAGEGLKFYLIPSSKSTGNADFMTVVSAAMGQSFFTLSVGIGSIAIFGSYIKKDRSLMGEAVTITALDTFVALMSGFIIFPACFTFAGGVNADASTVGASFLFTTLSGIFNSMGAVTGRIFGTLFFTFMIFAAFSTVIAVFENIISFWLEKTSLKRPVVCLINIGLLMVLTLPAIFSLGIWSNATVLGMGFLDLEDFIVSNLLLPVGSLIYVLFCTSRYGWGWKSFEAEVNTGNGLKFPKWIRYYMSYALPLIILFLMVFSIVSKFI